MTARIFKPCKSSAQSGLAKTKQWVLEFIPSQAQDNDPLMGWNSSADLYPSQVKLYFNSMEEAVDYAKRSKLEFTVTQPHQMTQKIKCYVDMYKKPLLNH